MTLKQFLARLRKTPRDWKLSEGRLRRDYNQCPISSLRGQSWLSFVPIAREFGIGRELREQIWQSADNRKNCDHFNKSVRRELLRACGLKEVRP